MKMAEQQPSPVITKKSTVQPLYGALALQKALCEVVFSAVQYSKMSVKQHFF